MKYNRDNWPKTLKKEGIQADATADALTQNVFMDRAQLAEALSKELYDLEKGEIRDKVKRVHKIKKKDKLAAAEKSAREMEEKEG